ncbi:hypothetical protein [Streptococcus pluranimalium]|nr:hypothetical protein [Streptococcus pluranimalium]
MGEIKSNSGRAQEFSSSLKESQIVVSSVDLDGVSQYQGNDFVQEQCLFAQKALTELLEAIRSAGNDIENISKTIDDWDQGNANGVWR